MGHALLFLVDRQGQAIAPGLRAAAESAHQRAAHDYPNVDSSLLATWAEQIGVYMAEKEPLVTSPRRYASAALQSRIREHFRSSGSREVSVGTDQELDARAGPELQSARYIERQVLFRELRSQLNERDRQIFILLQQDVTSPQGIASSLGISYSAAAKAVQRLRERLQAILSSEPTQLSRKEHDEND